MSRRRASKGVQPPAPAASRGDDELDAPLPARLLSERSGGWRKVLSSPDVAPMSLDRNLGFLTPDSDTEDTPPTAVPGQFRFDDDDDDDDDEGEVAAAAPAAAPESDPDEDAAFAALEAEISAARSAVRPALSEDEPAAPPAVVAADPPKAKVAPPATLPASEGWGWALAALVGAVLLVLWAVWG